MTNPRNEVCMVKWTFEHVSPKTYPVGTKIVSKSFTVAKLGYTRWRLELYPQGRGDELPAKYMSLFLRRLPCEPEHIEYTYKDAITIDVEFVIVGKTSRNMNGSRFSLFEYHGIIAIAEFSARSSALEIQAFFFYPRNRIHNAKSGYLALSNDMRELLNKQFYSNIEITCKNSSDSSAGSSAGKGKNEEKFNVHRNILMARAPKLADKLNLRTVLVDHEDFVVATSVIQGVPPETLKSILTYIYSGVLYNASDALTQELFDAVRELEIDDLVASLSPPPDSIKCESQFKRNDFNFVLHFSRDKENESSNIKSGEGEGSEEKRMSLYQEREVTECYFDKICMTCRAPLNIFDRRSSRMEVSVRIVGFKPEIPVYFILRVEHKQNIVSPYFIEELITEPEWVGDLLLVFKDYKLPLPNPLRLQIKFYVLDGGQISQKLTENRVHGVLDPTVCDLYKLSHDMFQLYTSEENADFELINHGKLFKVHKSILAARSPFYAKMLENCKQSDPKVSQDEEGEKIQEEKAPQSVTGHLSETGMRVLLSYLYKGEVPDMDYETSLEMYKEAVRCQMPELQSTCAEYLVKYLNQSNCKEITRFALAHNDAYLIDNCNLWLKHLNLEPVKLVGSPEEKMDVQKEPVKLVECQEEKMDT